MTDPYPLESMGANDSPCWSPGAGQGPGIGFPCSEGETPTLPC